MAAISIVAGITTVPTLTIAFFTGISVILSTRYSYGEARINDLVYIGFWVFFFLYLRRHYEGFIQAIKDHIRIVHALTLIWTIFIFISFFYSRSFVRAWGDVYFTSFASGPHRLASTCLIIMAVSVLMAQLKKDARFLLYLALPLVVIFMSGARTYLGVAFSYIICVYYIYCEKRSFFYLTIVPITAFAILAVFFSPIGEKIVTTMAYSSGSMEGYLARVTSGRSIFWVTDLEYFSGLSLWRKIVGDGVVSIYKINQANGHGYIWAHNDIINLLVSNGYLGCFLYLIPFISFIKYVFGKTAMPLFLKLGVVFTWFFNAMFNMVYTYTCSVLAIPLIYYSLSIRYEDSQTGSIT